MTFATIRSRHPGSTSARRFLAGLCVALLAPFAVSMVHAQATTAAPTTCKDGTTSTTTGKGACSHHGGVATATTGAAAATPAAPAAAATPAAPAAAAATVTCKDGSSSPAGRGACSHHGGVGTGAATAGAKTTAATPAAPGAPAAATPAAPKTTAAAATPAMTTAAAKTTGTAKSGTSENGDPTGAIAKCKDGLYSHSTHHAGTCSGHGGVAQWLDGSTK